VGDPLLKDLHTAVTLEEVKSYIALEHGQAITINLKRADDIVLPIVVLQNSTVLELKKAIQRHIVLKQARDNHTTHISWRHIWKRYWLQFENQKLTDDKKLIKDYGISNKDEVKFIRRLTQR
jgi:U11/U12 small nuclear ribonucleoprotein SNRNP25